MASRLPVEAPDGTAARPVLPSASRTSTSTVGLPRESRISRAWIDAIALMRVLLPCGLGVKRWSDGAARQCGRSRPAPPVHLLRVERVLARAPALHRQIPLAGDHRSLLLDSDDSQ